MVDETTSVSTESVGLNESVSDVPNNDVVVVEQKSDDVSEKFKAQLVQSIELNDKLILELEKKEKELSIFKELQNNLELVIQEKDNVIQQFKTEMDKLQVSKFNEKKDIIVKKWVSKFNLSPDQVSGVQRMLSKFTSEDELDEIEHMLELTVTKKVFEPVALTVPTTTITEQSIPVVIETFNAPEDRLKQLWNKVEALKKSNTY